MMRSVPKLSLPLKLVLILGFCLTFGRFLPVPVKEASYAVSLMIKEVLIFFLPLIVFSYLFSCIVGLKKSAVSFVLALLGCVCLSNFISTLIAYGVGGFLMSKLGAGEILAVKTTHVLKPLWNLALPRFIPNDYALFMGLIGGCFFAYRPSLQANRIADQLKSFSNLLLGKLFIPIVPFFILGFALKLQDEGTLSQLFIVYGPVFLLIATVELIYISFLYALGAGFNFSKWMSFLKNIFPSTISGFSTMSSAASMPITLEAAEKNTKNPDAVRAIIPATVNIHLMGDSIAIPLTAFIILISFGKAIPSFGSYLVFAFYFILAKFAIAAVPGGGILVMLPILEKHLGFSTEMLSLITALYIIFDPVITASNVSGNGAFAVLFTRFFFSKKSRR